MPPDDPIDPADAPPSYLPPAVFQPGAVAVTSADGQVVPRLIIEAGDAAGWRYVEFFAANIDNENTRRA